MKSILMVLSLALATAFAQPETYRIAGTVIDGATGRPIPRTRVAIASTEARDVETSTVTGPDGRFRFDGLKAAKYSLTADHHDGSRQGYGESEGGLGILTAIVTGPKLHTEDVVFRLLPPASLHGRIIDQDGEPIRGVLVQLFRSFIGGGSRMTLFSTSQYTNDLGEYRFAPLPAATYYVLAAGRPWYVATVRNTESAAFGNLSYAPVFYPNAMDVRSAAPIALKAGQDFVADMSMAAGPASHLMIAPKGGAPPSVPPENPPAGALPTRFAQVPQLPPVRIDVTVEAPGGVVGWERVETSYGNAELFGVPPGRYKVRVTGTDSKNPLYAQEDVVVGAGDTRLEVTLAPPPRISGRLRIEGSPRAIPRGTVIELENASENRHIRRAVADDGTFQFDALPPGKYLPILSSSTALLRIRGVSANGAPVKDMWIDINQSIELELSAVGKASTVGGFVYRGDLPQGSTLVLLVPKVDSFNRYEYLVFQTDSDGSFELTGVTPGDYLIFAVPRGAGFEYANPAVIKPYLETAIPLHVEKDELRTVRIDLP